MVKALTVKQLMRHSNIQRTVNVYLDLGLTDIGAAVNALPSLFNPDSDVSSNQVKS